MTTETAVVTGPATAIGIVTAVVVATGTVTVTATEAEAEIGVVADARDPGTEEVATAPAPVTAIGEMTVAAMIAAAVMIVAVATGTQALPLETSLALAVHRRRMTTEKRGGDPSGTTERRAQV